MTDINKLKLLINAEIIENRSYYALFNEGMKKGAEIAQSIILHQNRWRKVEEELPEVSNYKDLKCNFLAKTDYGYDIVTYYNDPKFLVGWFANAIRRNVIEWKPIS